MTNQPPIGLSILIPAYNYVCVNLVKGLQKQAQQLGISYEIIVADDGSTAKQAIKINRGIANIPNCTYIEREENAGRAAIRNFLAEQSKYAWLLFLDCDMQLPDGLFLKRYMSNATDDIDVIDGGISIGGDHKALGNNIRYLYEHRAEPKHTARERGKRPYKSFRTTNYMVRRKVALAYPFDQRFRHYGYEDVLFGKQLKSVGIRILHIDNPMVLTDYETNPVFIAKTEEAMRTLAKFKSELKGYSQIITAADTLSHSHLDLVIRLWHRLMGGIERKILTGNHPWLPLFNIYRLGYYLSLTK
ncbi:MAG: glycosyltransferase family 2 protein [Prevotella sp.]|nr:glycosyltransferase family 2 protein [Prevotella sp.]